MLYRLNLNYALRGWEKMAWTVVDQRCNQVKKLSSEEFQLLLLCDGETDLGNIDFTNEMKRALKKFETDHLIEKCEYKKPLNFDQYYRYYDNRYVQTVFWSITGKCNYRCRHCYMDAPDAALGEVSTAEALDFIDQMAECGVLQVDITGGEPFVRKDFWQLVDRMIYHKMTIGMVYTNGWLLTDKVLDEFERRNLYPEFSISFDGIGWHDWMRGVPGAEEAAIRALQLCKKRGFSTNVEICLHRGNLGVLMQTVEALCSVGVQAIKSSYVVSTPLWSHNSDGNMLSDQEYFEAMLRFIPEFYKAGRPVELLLGNIIYLHRNKPYQVVAERYDGTQKCLDDHLCGAARWACYITPEGRLLPCMPMTSSPAQKLFPRIQDIGLKQGLRDSFYMQFVDGRVKNLLEANAECNACAYRYKCGGGCRANALIEGDQKLMGCDRNMCMLWKEGYVERIRKAADDAIAKYGVPSKKGGSSEVDA